MKCPLGFHSRGGRHMQREGGTIMSTVVYVGMDVHKEKIVIANTPNAVKNYLAALLQINAAVYTTCEAGCFGFVLYRRRVQMWQLV